MPAVQLECVVDKLTETPPFLSSAYVSTVLEPSRRIISSTYGSEERLRPGERDLAAENHA